MSKAVLKELDELRKILETPPKAKGIPLPLQEFPQILQRYTSVLTSAEVGTLNCLQSDFVIPLFSSRIPSNLFLQHVYCLSVSGTVEAVNRNRLKL